MLLNRRIFRGIKKLVLKVETRMARSICANIVCNVSFVETMYARLGEIVDPTALRTRLSKSKSSIKKGRAGEKKSHLKLTLL